MNENVFLVAEKKRPEWLSYPQEFVRIIRQSLVDLTPWHVLTAEKALALHKGLATRYPERELFPFAYRQDNDDVACWSRSSGEKVLIIHDFADKGWEDEGACDDIWAWFRLAVEETIDWE